jgi:Escherichia/Staphylococcus phage prohead protease
MIRQTIPTSIRQLGDDEVECILSTGAVARDGHILVPQGCDLAGYRKTPIILYQHMPQAPVGTASAITVWPDRITAKITFAPLGVSATADEVRGLVKSGVVRSLSVGFDPKDGEPLDPKRPRDGQRFTSWELLECSFVSLPADTGAVVTARGYKGSGRTMMSKHLARLEVDSAAKHHDDCGRAMDRGDELGADRAHVKLGRCLRDCQRCFRDIHEQAALDDLKANQFAQNSDGMGKGTSDGRSYAARQADVIRLFPSASQRAAEAAALLPRPPVWDGGSVVHWAGAMRQYLQSDALHRATRINPGHRYSRVARQAEAARLARCP